MFATVNELGRILEISEDRWNDAQVELTDTGDILTSEHPVQEYVVVGGSAVYQPTQVYTDEQLRKAEAEALPGVVGALSDQQDAYESDTDAALFDIVDYIEALEARIAALEA